MKKFKRWLIHKLGGLCEDDVIKPNITLISNEKKVERIRAEIIVDREDIPFDDVKRILFDGICKELGKYYFEIKAQELNRYQNKYSMELEFILQ